MQERSLGDFPGGRYGLSYEMWSIIVIGGLSYMYNLFMTKKLSFWEGDQFYMVGSVFPGKIVLGDRKFRCPRSVLPEKNDPPVQF